MVIQRSKESKIFLNLLASGSFGVKHTTIYYDFAFDVREPSTSKQMKNKEFGSRLSMRIQENDYYQEIILKWKRDFMVFDFLRNLPKI